MGTIVYRDGIAYEQVVMAGFSVPEIATLYYPIVGYPPEGAETQSFYMDGCKVFFHFRLVGTFSYANGGKTLPTWVERKPVPSPKVRAGTEVRWSGYLGCWEKHLKSKGWVSVPNP